jgi:hypothetical protein
MIPPATGGTDDPNSSSLDPDEIKTSQEGVENQMRHEEGNSLRKSEGFERETKTEYTLGPLPKGYTPMESRGKNNLARGS